MRSQEEGQIKLNLLASLKNLVQLVSEDRATEAARTGICHYVEDREATDHDKDRVVGLLFKYFMGWEHYSGNKVFPVPSTTEGIDCRAQYWLCTGRLHAADIGARGQIVTWKGEQCELRLNLIEYMISRIEGLPNET